MRILHLECLLIASPAAASPCDPLKARIDAYIAALSPSVASPHDCQLQLHTMRKYASQYPAMHAQYLQVARARCRLCALADHHCRRRSARELQ